MVSGKGKTAFLPVILVLILAVFAALPLRAAAEPAPAADAVTPAVSEEGVPVSSLSPETVPAFSGEPFAVINGNVPDFYVWQLGTEPYVHFSPLDRLGRTGAGLACLGPETLPEGARGPLDAVTPSGWQNARYDDLIENRYLYNRSHVLGFQLCGDSATPENLFTGTDLLNSGTMLFFEDLVSDYLNAPPEEGPHHVLYRVTPFYDGDSLVASGIQMEAFSVEDFGAGVCFNIFAYNVQPGVEIDYATGESREAGKAEEMPGAAKVYAALAAVVLPAYRYLAPEPAEEVLPAAAETTAAEPDPAAKGSEEDGRDEDEAYEDEEKEDAAEVTYILNTNTMKFHEPDCRSVREMKAKNRCEFYGTREEAIDAGYSPCGRCRP